MNIRKVKFSAYKDRKKQILSLYKQCEKDMILIEEKIYKEVKRYYKKEQSQRESKHNIKDLMYNSFEETISTVTEETKKMYPSAYDETKELNLENLLYDEDSTRFEERVDYWFDYYPEEEDHVEGLAGKMFLLLDTETRHMIPRIMTGKLNPSAVFIGIEPGYGCSRDCCNTPIEPGDAVLEEEIDFDEPPYHPNCGCFEVIYETEDIVEIITEEV